MNFFEMMKQEEASKKQNNKQDEQVQNDENVQETKNKAEKTAKKDVSQKNVSTKSNEETFEYPFSLYTEGRTVDISNYGFEEGTKYTTKQITEIMLRHRHYEFAGEMTYKMFEDDNMLVATAKQ